MSSRAQRDKGQAQNTNQAILSELLKEEENRYCADCGAKGPRWASWNLGVFLCIRCAGIHRNLGVHISRVKSVNLDSWTPEQMDSIQQWGNKRAAEFWECYLPSDFRRPQTDSTVEAFIRSKYERKQYLKKDGLPPTRSTSNSAKETKSSDKRKRREKKEEGISITPLKIEAEKKVAPAVSSVAQPRPHSHPPPVKAPEPAKPAALVDLLSLDTPAPAPAGAPAPVSSAGLLNSLAQPMPAASQPAKTGLESELIDFGAFQANTTIDTGFSQSQQLNTQVPQESNQESLLKDDSTTNKSTKDSIMALYAPKTQGSQPQMYGVPGGMYIPPQQHQQQPLPNQHPAMFNRMGAVPPQGVGAVPPHGMPVGMGVPRQPAFMQQQQQQQQQVAQIQQQMQQMRLKQQMPPQQMNMPNGNPNMFASAQPSVSNGWMPQQPMSFPQQQHPQFVTTGPIPNGMAGYGAYPMGSVPGSGQTLSHQLWK
ncbi:stromal membrane-associated protein 1-like isoform X3 [Pocillopora damicornis]|uniref:stromal membrane-associated protein 1-like isoform X3 n=1 Tax=Pocillopora damicornis TaxID=46731 RepID=UPI000F55056B|nr:stromal membrane-associated protein 1-like isoform X3 [Pocillopora damicornis]